MSKKSIETNEDAIVIIKTMHENGDSKDVIAAFIFQNGVAYNQINKLIKAADVTFRRHQGNTWKDLAADAFIENPDLDEAGMLKAIGDSVKDPEYYVKGYYMVFSKLAHK